MSHSLETRLGIVMDGGVSLPVCENGVAQELFRAVRGEPRRRGVYDLVKSIADTDVVVDVLSGTSAGGVNGIFLGYALANGKDFRECATLWREKGDIMALLRKPKDVNVASLLDSCGYYQTEMEGAFHRMDEHPYGAPYESEIDLFITGTDVHGRVFTEFDDQGHSIDVKDHRTIFVLSYRPERKNEFESGNIAELAKLARITSCFPVAFEPVHVLAPSPNADGADPDALLRRWGNLTHDAYFLDGGLLDNKPFSYAIDAIFGRLAERPGDRMLQYVEPDPEHFNNEPLKETPNVVKAASDALTAIPGHESIANDLQAIAERNTKLARYEEIRESLDELPKVKDFLNQDKPDDLAALKLLKRPTSCIYIQTRFAQLRDRALLGILKQNGKLRRLDGKDRRAAKVLVDSFAA
jgi:patatin-related protein